VHDTRPTVSIAAFFREVARARRSALLLDYDGTLAPFELDRNQAVPYPGVTEILHDIMDTGRTRVVIISGRRAQELGPLLRLSPPPEIWGTHGLERLQTDGTYEVANIDHSTLESLDEADRWVDSLKLHNLLEHKPGSLAMHWRGLPQQQANEIRSEVMRGWVPISERACLTLQRFDGGVEIRMADRSKADAVHAVLAEMDVHAPVAYLGDDDTDEDAFHALQDRGLRVLVRPHWRATDADLWLRPPVQLMAFLDDWLAACGLGASSRVRAQPIEVHVRHAGK
jgi:trehalose 6-phosphate phosphatase